MYEKYKCVALKASASALNNNLCCHVEQGDKVHLAVVHKSKVNILTLNPHGDIVRLVSGKGIGGSSSAYHTLISQAKWVTVGKRTVFVIASQRGIQVFESDGCTLLYWHGFSSHDADVPEETFARGITACGVNLLCVGTYDGTILVFHVPCDANTITFSEKLRGHQIPIADLCGNSLHLASADDSGSICLWTGETSLKKLFLFSGTGVPCTSLSFWNNFLVASFGSGQLSVYDISEKRLIAEVDAHARWITAIDIAQETGLMLSVSEDCYIRVWQLKTGHSPVISLKFSENVPDSPLHGCSFLNNTGNTFCVSGYDLHDILCYRM